VLIPIIPIADFQKEFLEFLDSILPPQTSDFFSQNIFENISKESSGSILSTVFILSIILMANGVNAIFAGFESSYHQQASRSIFQQYLYALGVALILAMLVILTVAIFGYFQIYIIQPLYNTFTGDNFSETGSALKWIMFGKYLFFIIMTYIATATLYYFGTREGRDNKFFSVGALLTTLLIMLTSFLFGVYIDNFSKYNELYGSIGALLILLFYLWLNSNILLLGYELNASLNRLRKINS
jgi:membrane protein